jgi:hypothetical protein
MYILRNWCNIMDGLDYRDRSQMCKGIVETGGGLACAALVVGGLLGVDVDINH